MCITPRHDGHIIEDQYEFLEVLGSGSHGQVVKVLDHRLDRVCALKFYSAPRGGRETWKEAQTLQSLRGNYILPVHNAGLAEGVPFIITDVASQGTVSERIPSGIGLPVPQCIRWIREACQGISRIHDAGMVHRDIKPENLFLDKSDKLLVGDLGIASFLDGQGVALPDGTPATMAPEVARALNAQTQEFTPSYSVKSEIYSLGATLWWMLAGTPPPVYEEDDAKNRSDSDIWNVAPQVPRKLRDVVNQAMAFAPSDRFNTAPDLDAALGNLVIPERMWERISRHRSDHIHCFIGIKKGAGIGVCAKSTDGETYISIEASHLKTGRRLRRVERRSDENQLGADLRATFRACG